MGSIWDLANIDELDFAASATLLAIRAKQQSIFTSKPSNTQSNDDSDSEYDGEDEYTASDEVARLTAPSRNALIDKFLDRLGEVFSREKSSSQQQQRRNSEHVAATAWLNPDTTSPLTVLVAKNGGLDDRDRKMASQLQLWLRTVAVTGRHPSILTDIIWKGKDFGLVDYSRSRLWYHISQVNEIGPSVDRLAAGSGSYGALVKSLQKLCQKATVDSTIPQLGDIVKLAYRLRSAWKGLQTNVQHTKVMRTINMLGRLRAAYECFKDVALTFDEVSTIEIRPMDLYRPLGIYVNAFRESLLQLIDELKLPKGILKQKAAERLTWPSALHVHAEMQLLVSLATTKEWENRSHRYIGTSKKPCFLCNQMLQHYNKISMIGTRKATFRARRSHGKVYPLWTLPSSIGAPPIAGMALAAAVKYTYQEVRGLLHHKLVLKNAIAESSAGITNMHSVSGGLTAAQKRYLDSQRTSNATKSTDEAEESVQLGPKIASAQVGLLPADASGPRLVSINFHAIPENGGPKLREIGLALVPDFHDYWGDYQFNRRYNIVHLENQGMKEWEGKYRLYWNESGELPENETIKSMLGITSFDAARRFWYGDAFVVRFSEHPKTYAFKVHDAPATIGHCPALVSVFRNFWETEFLEYAVEADRERSSSQEKIEADKAVLLGRM